MSKRRHNTIAHEIAYIVKQITMLSEEEASATYGIEFRENGKIYDPTYFQEFENIGDWARFNVEEDNTEYEEHFHGKDHEEN